MKTIYKYPLLPLTNQILLPEGAEFLCVQEQNDAPYMWFVVDTTAGKKHREFTVRPTGTLFEPATKEDYLGTFQIHKGAFVFHVFEILEA